MVCPMRVFVFAASLVLVVASLFYFLYAQEQPAFLNPSARPQRTWGGFVWAFFSGELLRDAWYGPPPPPPPLESGGSGREGSGGGGGGSGEGAHED